MATPYVPLLLPLQEVKFLSEVLAVCIKTSAPVLAAPCAEIKHKLDDALKQLGIVSKETPGS